MFARPAGRSDRSRWRSAHLKWGKTMRFDRTASVRAAFLALVFAQAARAGVEEMDRVGEDVHVRDVGPEMGVLFHPFLFRGPGEVLENSNRGGTFTTRDRGERWRRSMRGLVDSAGVEAFDFITCQARSARSVLYAATIEDGLFRSDDFAVQ